MCHLPPIMLRTTAWVGRRDDRPHQRYDKEGNDDEHRFERGPSDYCPQVLFARCFGSTAAVAFGHVAEDNAHDDSIRLGDHER